MNHEKTSFLTVYSFLNDSHAGYSYWAVTANQLIRRLMMMMMNITNDTTIHVLMGNITQMQPVKLYSSYTYWATVDSLLFITIISGNVLTILAIRLTRRLRNVISNYFILSLAISDLMVGLTLPYRLVFYLSDFLSTTKITCLLRFILICFTCCASIYNVTAIAVDRYIAVVHPLKYIKFMTKKVVFMIIIIGWIYSFTIATMPLYWNCFNFKIECKMEEVLPRYYSMLILTPTLLIVWLIMFLVYWKIGKEARMSTRRLQVNNMNAAVNDRKSVQVVLLILGCFSICWLPFSVVACTRIFHWHRSSTPILYEALFSLALANSGMNPIIYAWKNSKFRKTFQRLLHCQLPDQHDYNTSLKNYMRKQKELRKSEAHFDSSETKENVVLRNICNLYTLDNDVSLRSNVL